MTSKKKFFPKFWVAGFGGACDCFGSGLQTFSLFFVSPSIFSIAKNATVVFTALFSVVYLKKALPRFKVLSILIIMMGFIIVAISSIVFPDKDKVIETNLSSSFNFGSFIGILCLFVSLIFQGFTYCYQEKVLDEYEIKPSQMIGFESMMGAIVSTLIFLVTGFIKCTNSSYCNFKAGQPIDSPVYAFYDLQYNYAWLYFMLLCFSIMIFNLVGLIIVKYSGAVLRVVLDTLRTICVWVISIFIGFESLNNPWKVSIEIIGFIFLLLGNLIYNEIFVIKCCGLDVGTKQHTDSAALYESVGNTDVSKNESENNDLILKEQK